jgi:hypothetical protein
MHRERHFPCLAVEFKISGLYTEAESCMCSSVVSERKPFDSIEQLLQAFKLSFEI